MGVDIARFILHTTIIFSFIYYLYVWVFEILIHNKILYGKYFPKQEDYNLFVERHNTFHDDIRKR